MFFHILFHVNLHRKFTMGVSLLFSYFCEETEVSVSGKLVMFLCRPCMGESECKFKEIDKVLFQGPHCLPQPTTAWAAPCLVSLVPVLCGLGQTWNLLRFGN